MKVVHQDWVVRTPDKVEDFEAGVPLALEDAALEERPSAGRVLEARPPGSSEAPRLAGSHSLA